MESILRRSPLDDNGQCEFLHRLYELDAIKIVRYFIVFPGCFSTSKSLCDATDRYIYIYLYIATSHTTDGACRVIPFAKTYFSSSYLPISFKIQTLEDYDHGAVSSKVSEILSLVDANANQDDD